MDEIDAEIAAAKKARREARMWPGSLGEGRRRSNLKSKNAAGAACPVEIEMRSSSQKTEECA